MNSMVAFVLFLLCLSIISTPSCQPDVGQTAHDAGMGVRVIHDEFVKGYGK